MSKDSQIFLKVSHLLIADATNFAEKMLLGSAISNDDLLGGYLSENEIEILRSIPLTDEQRKAIHTLLIAVGRLSVCGVLGMIDGIVMSDKFETPNLSLINRDTGKDIVDTCLLNEEFDYYNELFEK
jgi:hypothetical protein